MYVFKDSRRCGAEGFALQKYVCIYVATLTVLCPQDGATALHLAAEVGKVDVVRLLIDTEAQVNIQTKVHTL